MIFTNWIEKRKKEKQRKLRIDTAKKLLIGTAAGSVSGLLGGLLFSPKSGKENREDIANTSKELTNNIKEKTIEIKQTVDNKVSDAKDNVSDAKVKIKQKSIELKDAMSNKVSEAKNNVTDAKVKVSQYLNEKKTSKVASAINDAVTDNDDSEAIVGQVEVEIKK
ncbi:YtxH domain-containing protein [Clostridium bowmanii]|uniref:YtxH domain-containing protein n=1 Tax=Clostridium bowmanii TaxID=132925 RepID=UPI001C0DFD52|nr:YtxH domain-containing protein [Clostridium bowmanii]MBU3189832.1 YtxH domain-containing protein [Clostridium bowmanii]MCA1074316.1 YtxH domain-containing protein [Clostridium bowmanii]